MQFTIAFKLVDCVCGGQRQAAQVCPHCGTVPTESDPHVEGRKRLVQLAREPLPAHDEPALDIESAFGLLQDWTNWFLHALEQAVGALGDAPTTGEVEASATALREWVASLDALERRAAKGPRLRPSLRIWHAVDDLIATLRQMRDEHLRGLLAQTPAEAERHAVEAQGLLDQASLVLDHFNQFTDVWRAIEDAPLSDEFGDIVAGASAISVLTATGDLADIDQRGRSLLRRITGDDTECPVGIGLALLHLDVAAQASFDTERLWREAGVACRVASSQVTMLQGLAADPSWRDDIHRISTEARDAGFELIAIAEATSNRRRQLQATLRLGARLFERVAPPLLATLLAASRRGAYAREKKKDPFTLVRELQQAGLGSLLYGLDPRLRDADAHAAYDLTESGVIFTGTRGSLNAATDTELLDLVIGATESITAMYWGVLAALIQLGTEAEDLEQLISTTLDPKDQIRYVLHLSGWLDVEVRIEGEHLDATGCRDAPNQLGLVAAVISALPEDVQTARFVRRGAAGDRVLEGPVAPFRIWNQEPDELQKERAFTRASMLWQLDGQAIITSDLNRKLIAYRAAEAMHALQPAEQLRSLRVLLDDARASSDSELAAVLSSALRGRRAQISRGDDTEVASASEKLISWASMDCAGPLSEF